MPDECCHGLRTSQGARGYDSAHHLGGALNTLLWFLLELSLPFKCQKLCFATKMFEITLLAFVNHVTFPTRGGDRAYTTLL
jgi:hypothetical protein